MASGPACRTRSSTKGATSRSPPTSAACSAKSRRSTCARKTSQDYSRAFRSNPPACWPELGIQLAVLHGGFEFEQEAFVFRIVLRARDLAARERLDRLQRSPVGERGEVGDVAFGA